MDGHISLMISSHCYITCYRLLSNKDLYDFAHILYTIPPGYIFKVRKFDYQSYTDDTQLYIIFILFDVSF